MMNDVNIVPAIHTYGSAHDTLIEASRLNAQGVIDLSAGNAAIFTRTVKPQQRR